MIVKGGFVHVAFALIKRITINTVRRVALLLPKTQKKAIRAMKSSIRMHTGLIISDLPEILHLKIT